jgi:pimeloyl-ACP methyl ester carboxylesterase
VTEPREIRLPTASGELAGLRGGDPQGNRLLALHGWLDNAASFLPLFPHLADFDLVALDLPGHGASKHRAPGHDYAFVDWIHDVADALDALGWESAHLLGHSMGGGIASVFAAAWPQRVRRLVLIEAPGPLSGPAEEAGKRLRSAAAHRRALQARPPSQKPIATLEIALQARLASTPMREQDALLIVERNLRAVEGGYLWRSDPRLRLPAHVRLPEAAVQSILREIAAPTLLVAADPPPEYFTPEVRAQRLACLAQIELEVRAGDHHLHMSQAEALGPRIAAFLHGG